MFGPDPNDMTAVYAQILIHATNGPLFPNVDPGGIAWTGLSPGVVAVQALFYAGLTKPLFTPFVAVLGKQRISGYYIRNHGGSAADKTRDRQRNLDGFEKWHFRFDTYHVAVSGSPGRHDPSSHPSLPLRASRESPATFTPEFAMQQGHSVVLWLASAYYSAFLGFVLK